MSYPGLQFTHPIYGDSTVVHEDDELVILESSTSNTK